MTEVGLAELVVEESLPSTSTFVAFGNIPGSHLVDFNQPVYRLSLSIGKKK